jgi:hypothetical protein
MVGANIVAYDCALSEELSLTGAMTAMVLGFGAAPPQKIEKDLAVYAIHRHGVGPLLWSAVRTGTLVASSEARTLLQESHQKTAFTQARVQLFLKQISVRLDEARIPWMVLKGWPQARQLYPDPVWRPSGDIDLLVDPRDYQRAVLLFEGLGFVSTDVPAGDGLLRKVLLPLFRDVTLAGSKMAPLRIELHQRPLYSTGRLSKACRLTVDPKGGPFPAPALGADLGFYLFVHGALCRWARLKWLNDWALLLAKIDDGEKEKMAATCAAVRVEASFAASLVLLREIFPAVPLGSLAQWLASYDGAEKVKRRLANYVRTLNLRDTRNATPMDGGVISFSCKLLFHEAFWDRVRLAVLAPGASLLRRGTKKRATARRSSADR